MFSHVMVGARSIPESRAFYDALFAAIGVKPGVEDEKGRIFWITGSGMFAISVPIDGQPATPANGGTIGFVMASPEQTEAWHAAGLGSGGTTCEDPPGWRDGQLGRIYLAYLRDPASNKLCALYRPR